MKTPSCSMRLIAEVLIEERGREDIRLIVTGEKSRGKEKLHEKINSDSLVTIKGVLMESFVKHALPEQKFQFFRHGYFCVDKKYSTIDRLVFNRRSFSKNLPLRTAQISRRIPI